MLVTGGAGFIGSHLVDALVGEGHRVRILDALVPQVHGDAVPPHLNPNAEFLRADVCSRDAVDNALEGIDAVFHEAAEVGVGQSMYRSSAMFEQMIWERRYCSRRFLPDDPRSRNW